jgi:hypothetical protein
MIGGRDARQDEIPGILGIRSGTMNHFGAALIAVHEGRAVALTAAHCMHYDLNTVTVHGGSLQWKDSPLTARVTEYFVHPKYAPADGIDLAILILDNDLSGVTPAPHLAGPDDVGYYDLGAELIWAGWGLDGSSEEDPANPGVRRARSSPNLQVASLKQVSPGTCRTMEGEQLNANFACCRSPNEAHTMAGDSGGPVLSPDHSKLVGVVRGSGMYNASIATRVDRHLQWIRDPGRVHSYVVDSHPTAIIMRPDGRKYITHADDEESGKISVRDAG